MLGDPAPWDPLDLPWDEMPDTPGVPRDRAARPSLDAVLALRRDRMATVRQVVDGLTDESLAGQHHAGRGTRLAPPRSYPVRECLRIGPQRGVGAPPLRRARPDHAGSPLRAAADHQDRLAGQRLAGQRAPPRAAAILPCSALSVLT